MPIWATEVIGGWDSMAATLVTEELLPLSAYPFDSLFPAMPIWATEVIGGWDSMAATLVTEELLP
ncbi:hypothetical protein V5H42_25855, partial [Salmonella enterica]